MSKDTVVACYHLDGRFCRIYPSAFIASQRLHISRNGIYDCLKGRKKSCHKYMWREFSIDEKIPDTIEPYEDSLELKGIKVAQYDLKGERIATYPNSRIAAKKLKVSPTTISNCINGNFKTVKGFFFIKDGDIDRLNYLIDNNNYYYSTIIQLDSSGKVIAKYSSTSEAEKVTGIKGKTIAQAIRRNETAGGYHWKGKKNSNKKHTLRGVVACYTFNGDLVRIYSTAKGAAESLGLFARSVDKSIRMSTSVGGYQWRRYESEDNVLKVIEPYKVDAKSRISKPVIRIDEKGNEIEFKSIKFAAAQSNISTKQIRECLLGHQNQAGGYKWKLK